MTSLGDIVAFNLTDDLRSLRCDIEDLARSKLPVPLPTAKKAAWDHRVSRLKLKLREKQALNELLKDHQCAATQAVRQELRLAMQALLSLLQEPEICSDLLSEQMRDLQVQRQEILQLTHELTLSPSRLPVLTIPRSPTQASDPLFAVLLGVGILVDFVHGVLRRRK